MSEVYASAAAQINDYRRRILAGESLNKEELANAILTLRQSRVKASATSTAARTEKATKSGTRTPIDLNALFAKKENTSS